MQPELPGFHTRYIEVLIDRARLAAWGPRHSSVLETAIVASAARGLSGSSGRVVKPPPGVKSAEASRAAHPKQGPLQAAGASDSRCLTVGQPYNLRARPLSDHLKVPQNLADAALATNLQHWS